MRRYITHNAAWACVLGVASAAVAQSNPRPVRVAGPTITTTITSGADGPGYDMSWFTIDGGGAVTLSGGGYSLGCTSGQPDAGTMSGGGFELNGGFWFGVQHVACYPNCDHSTIPPILNVQDFSCFLNAFANGDSYANCDNSTTPPALNVQDFACFLNAYAAGCS